MALTRKFLKGLEIDDAKIDLIIDAHTDTVNGLKDRLEKVENDSKDAATLQKKLEEAERALEAAENDGYREKYEKEHKALADLRQSIAAKESKAAKEAAARAYLDGKGITGDNAEIALRGMSAEIDAAELDGEKFKDTAAFDALVNGVYRGLISTTETRGADTATPPATAPDSGRRTGSSGLARQIEAAYYSDRYGAAQPKGEEYVF